LLSRLSRARPEVADYPFTTKFPNLGLVTADLDTSFVLADIPGLIEGAADGVGLGHDFLRHVMRAGILVHLVEPQPIDGSDPLHNYEVIRQELEHYSLELAERPEILVVSKAELPEAEQVGTSLRQQTGKEVLLISAVTGQGLNELIRTIAATLNAQV
jgi:GTP-binding protein